MIPQFLPDLGWLAGVLTLETRMIRRTTDKIDDLARRAFEGEPGANSSFASRLRMRVTAERAAARSTRVNRIRAAVIVAAAATLVMLLALNVDWSRGASSINTDGTARQNTQQNRPAGEVPEAAPKVEPRGEHATPPANEASRDPRLPAANTPQEKPETAPPVVPKEPAPEKQPEPKEIPDPKEKPELPEGEVEKPKPEVPDDKTGVPPVERRQLATVAAIEKGAKPRIRYADGEAWRELGPEEKLLSGAQISSSGSVDLTLSSGALIRFDGEIGLDGDEKELRVDLRKETLYADNLAVTLPLVVTAGELRAEMADGVAVFEPGVGGLRISVLHGRVATVHGEIAAGLLGVLTRRNLPKPRAAIVKVLIQRLIKGLPPRLLMREEFDGASGRDVYAGTQTDSVVSAKGANACCCFRLQPDFPVLAGATLRVRCRTRNADSLLLQMFCTARNDNFGHELKPGKAGEWTTLEVPLSELLDRATGKVPASPGVLLTNFQMFANGKADTTLEIDWVEIVRVAQ